MPVAGHLRAYRLAAGVSQVALAARAGSARGVVSKLERGRADPGRKTAVKLFWPLDPLLVFGPATDGTAT
jgi:transcriptional regulator with XRE-family HTH domain